MSWREDYHKRMEMCKSAGDFTGFNGSLLTSTNVKFHVKDHIIKCGIDHKKRTVYINEISLEKEMNESLINFLDQFVSHLSKLGIEYVNLLTTYEVRQKFREILSRFNDRTPVYRECPGNENEVRITTRFLYEYILFYGGFI